MVGQLCKDMIYDLYSLVVLLYLDIHSKVDMKTLPGPALPGPALVYTYCVMDFIKSINLHSQK